jgi:uncharacterized protein
MGNDARVTRLIERLSLVPHPEGGRYHEVYRSSSVTTIAFLVTAGEVSRWHRVLADEIWHFYEGDPLALWMIDPDGSQLIRAVLGADDHRMHAVPAGYWQAARPLGAYALVGCDVAPAFQFANFSLLADTVEPRVRGMVERHPEVFELL